MDPTSPGLSMPYQSFVVWYVPGAVYGGAGRPVGSPESAATSVNFKMASERHR